MLSVLAPAAAVVAVVLLMGVVLAGATLVVLFFLTALLLLGLHLWMPVDDAAADVTPAGVGPVGDQHYRYGATRPSESADLKWVDDLPEEAQKRVHRLLVERNTAATVANQSMLRVRRIQTEMANILASTGEQMREAQAVRRAYQQRTTLRMSEDGTAVRMSCVWCAYSSTADTTDEVLTALAEHAEREHGITATKHLKGARP
ncbi:DUF1059 domain-containing protein [Kocuria sp.]|uniref:DUF1059 domain-containing protein n=1 Tax=Kocuria sp. TaxID=1871328 RepID=UPI0026E0DB69|nr:DUF1059 domain-containing protein [Kocuria sp.]MDO5619302.1 DUF1059 domain-containing protein [Kocuria sp.]